MTNDTDMLGDTDDLRSVLRSRAALAPNPDDLIPATRPLARRRRRRRRGVLLGGVVVLTTLALLSTALLRSIEAPVTPAGQPLHPPVFPFTVGPLPDGMVPTGWQSMGSDLTFQSFTRDSMDFTGPHAHATVEWVTFDPALTVQPSGGFSETRTTVHGTAATFLTDPTGHYLSLSWPTGVPERWFDVEVQAVTPNPIGESTALAIADAVTAQPSGPPTTLDIAYRPVGFRAFGWLHDTRDGVTDYVELCPTTMTTSSGESSCFTVIASDGSQTIMRAFFGNFAQIHRVRRVHGDVWVGVYPDRPAGISTAEIDVLLWAVSVG